MALGDNYVTDPELARHLQIGDNQDAVAVGQAADAASRWVERYCGRTFNDAGSGSARVFTPDNTVCVRIDDCHTITAVATDTGNDGNYATTITAYHTQPSNGVRDGVTGWPVQELISHTGQWPTTTYRPGVQVTATWGWAAVPDAVKAATLIQAARIFGRRYAANGLVGQGDFVFRVSNQTDPEVAALLDPYRRVAALVA